MPLEGFPRKMAMFTKKATPNCTFHNINSGNVALMEASTTQELEARRSRHELQRDGVPMVGKVRLHGFATGLIKDRLPGGAPFRHSPQLTLVQPLAEIIQTCSLDRFGETS